MNLGAISNVGSISSVGVNVGSSTSSGTNVGTTNKENRLYYRTWRNKRNSKRRRSSILRPRLYD